MNKENFNPSEWQEYADEHVLLIRALDSVCPSVFETIKINRMYHDTVMYRHEVIFIDDYLNAGLATLNDILKDFGYDGLDDFVVMNSDNNEWVYSDSEKWVYDEHGNLDRENSPAYIIDMWHLASLIAEARGGQRIHPDEADIIMSETDALKLLKETTGVEYATVGGVGGDSTQDKEPNRRKHISEIVEDDTFLCGGDDPWVAIRDAYINGDGEWAIEASSIEDRLLDYEGDIVVTEFTASRFVDGMVEMADMVLTISKHISEVVAGDRIIYDGQECTAEFNASMTKTGNGKEWNVECVGEDGEDIYLYASYFEEGFVHVIAKKDRNHD